MPIYEFECRDCGVFQLRRPMSEYRQDAPCPSCRRDAARAIYTAPGLSSASILPSAAPSGGSASAQGGAAAKHGGACGCCSKVVFPTGGNADGSANGSGKNPWKFPL